MACFLSILSTFLHIPEVNNLKKNFSLSFDIQKADYNLLNMYIMYKFNKYETINIKDYSLWDFI